MDMEREAKLFDRRLKCAIVIDIIIVVYGLILFINMCISSIRNGTSEELPGLFIIFLWYGYILTGLPLFITRVRLDYPDASILGACSRQAMKEYRNKIIKGPFLIFELLNTREMLRSMAASVSNTENSDMLNNDF